MTKPFTHHRDHAGNPYCKPCGKLDGHEKSTWTAEDYADEANDGRDTMCHACLEPVFPADYEDYLKAQREFAQACHEEGEWRWRLNALSELQRADPMAFYLTCKNDPDAIEQALEDRRGMQ